MRPTAPDLSLLRVSLRTLHQTNPPHLSLCQQPPPKRHSPGQKLAETRPAWFNTPLHCDSCIFPVILFFLLRSYNRTPTDSRSSHLITQAPLQCKVIVSHFRERNHKSASPAQAASSKLCPLSCPAHKTSPMLQVLMPHRPLSPASSLWWEKKGYPENDPGCKCTQSYFLY